MWGIARRTALVTGVIGFAALGFASDGVPVLTMRGDPATSMSVTWRTSVPQGSPIEARGPKGRVAAPIETVGVTLPSGAKWFYHSARMIGLTPDTAYQYRIGAGPWLQFHTAKRTGPLTFLYFGDVQTEIHAKWPGLLAQALKVCPKPAFMIFAGDLVDSAHDDAQWVDFFRPGANYFGQIPTIATPGNHEYKSLIPHETARLSYLWKPQWDYPLNGFPGLDEQSYVVDIQGVRIVSMNSNRFVKEQAVWFDKLSHAFPSRWTLTTYHHPAFSQAVGRDNPLVRTLWDPVFRKNNVALAMQGHDHCYARRDEPRDDGKGESVYVVAVAGTKMYRMAPQARQKCKASYERTRSFQVITIDGDTLYYRAYGLDGKTLDQFKMIKRPGGFNQVVP